MVATLAGVPQHVSLTLDQLLRDGEVAVIVDDDPAIREPLHRYFASHGLAVEECADASSLLDLLTRRKVALMLLDIGLPDIDGVTLLPRVVEKDSDIAVVMLTGVADLQVALECMRQGATDYISKPANFDQIFHVARRALEKRRLLLENRKYQEELEEAHFRLRLLHQLSLKMNNVYLSTVELDEILQAVLVGITAQEGLGFNRAFLAMFTKDDKELRGHMAIGPGCREEAGRIWGEMREKGMDFGQIVQDIKQRCTQDDSEVNRIVRRLTVSADEHDNLLIKAVNSRRSALVSRELGGFPLLLHRHWGNGEKDGNGGHLPAGDPLPVPHELTSILGEDSFVVVPLYSPGRAFGVIIADNYVTGRAITGVHVSALELFASQASLAIEQSHLYQEMQQRLAELEALYDELNRSKDLLVEAERYSAIGQMAAQLVHTIRNPITSIGGVSRILEKKSDDESWGKYIKVITRETARLESTLNELFDFVSQVKLEKQPLQLCDLVKKTLLLLQQELKRQQITWDILCPPGGVTANADERQMRQVFLHLLKNSVEAMPHGGQLTITILVEEEQAVVKVRDTGTGLPSSQVERARDPFFTTKTYGTGMGLTLVEKAVEAHGGTFSLKTAKNGGMEATVRIPL
ncbi:response regulator [Desulfurivibrio alkaliphilus]|uniref:histidine kinase n=1 Tax=Desulfurivibrio alkaliphilus (strain DSM 19089 / UNIQEM U267 / AHT2) TaxID=589865 RepID=D6Z516_DESAT|nr:response regulator [Desulfurivibrio alkaliphilus]ADH86641.1 multi-sensor signal transduction histidine kinase [Desulfurivibrio alkaliphilus AHT 2]